MATLFTYIADTFDIGYSRTYKQIEEALKNCTFISTRQIKANKSREKRRKKIRDTLAALSKRKTKHENKRTNQTIR
jgi:hypothetical protein